MLRGQKGGSCSWEFGFLGPHGVMRRGLSRAVWTIVVLAAMLLVVALSSGANAADIVTEIPVPTVKSGPYGIVLGPDGNLWFTEEVGDKIGRITPAGAIAEFPIPTPNSKSTVITAGPDGNLWFTGYFSIGRITPAGVITEFPLPAGSVPVGIVSGPDGNLWFAERDGNRIGRITPDGAITEFPVPTPASNPVGIASGPDGNLWFTEWSGNQIGQITIAGIITEFPVPTHASNPLGIAVGPDGNLWFTEFIGNKIGRITPEGVITEFAVPTVISNPVGIAAGPYGDLWFTEEEGNNIGRITTAGVLTEFPVPTVRSHPVGIAAGPDGNLWFTEEEGNNIGRISGCPAISLAPAGLPGGTVATAYSQALSSTGGTGPYTYAVTGGSLPAGLALSPDGVLAGTPTAEGTSEFTITATDIHACTGSTAYSLAIACLSITLAPTALPNGAAGEAYSQAITASGGSAPYIFGVSSGSLPPGLGLSTGGVLSGTCDVGGTFHFTVGATDANSCTGSREYAFTVTCPTISLAPETLPGGTVGSAYGQLVTASGGVAPYTYAVTAGDLPAGLSLAQNGALSGAPTEEGTSSFTIAATDAHACTGSKTYSITVVCLTITLVPSTLSNGTVGVAYSRTILANGGTSPYTYAVSGGTPPTGVSITSDGVLSGTPTEAGTFSFTVTATDVNRCTGSQAYTVTMVCPTILVSPSGLPGGTIGVAYSQTMTATGGTAPYTYSASGGSLPTGLSLTAGGLLAGIPTAGGTFDFTVTATDANACAGSQAYSITTVCPGISLLPSTLPDGTVGAAYGQAITASGSTVPFYTYAKADGTLPAGLSLTSSGLLYGTPTTPGDSTFTVTATDADGCTGSRGYSVTIRCAPMTLSPSSLPNGKVGAPYDQTVTTSGGVEPITYAMTSGSLPGGLVLSSGGVLSGTPTASGTFSFTVTATDVNSCTGSQGYSVSVMTGIPGDCDGNGQVSIGEVQKAINMFLGLQTVACGVDCNGDGTISIGEVQKVINIFLGVATGC